MAGTDKISGKIVKAVSGFYYVHTEGNKVYSCKARGIFRQMGIKPLVGDNVLIDVISDSLPEGNLSVVCERRNVLIRPAAANVDQALVVFAVKEPDPNLNLLDRFLIYMGVQDIPVIIYFNKSDLDKDEDGKHYREIYEKAGYTVVIGSTSDEKTIDTILQLLHGKTTVLAGPSGAGKSSLTNMLYKDAGMEVGELSEKIKRGKQTTRHTELFAADDETFLLDTPGFTSLYVSGVSPENLRYHYEELLPYAKGCKYLGCSHVNEPEKLCSVKRAVSEGKISRERFDNYCQIYKELLVTKTY